MVNFCDAIVWFYFLNEVMIFLGLLSPVLINRIFSNADYRLIVTH